MNELIDKAKALSSETRWRILNLTHEKPLMITEIANELNQTEANISAQVKILEKAGLIHSFYKPGEHGVRKMVQALASRVIIYIKKGVI